MNDMVVHEIRPSALMSAADVLTQVKVVQEVMHAVMKKDTHYGVIPGTEKPSLWKPGAEVLCAVFRVADSYGVEDLSTEDCVRYRVTCRGTHQTSGIVLGEGMGECSSNEKKYKWVKAYQREWDATPENRRRKQFGWDKTKRQEYEILQVRTESADLANTILKMANKRAKIAMTLNVTAASDCFTQDIEDLDERLRETLEGEEGSGGAEKREPVKSKSGDKDKPKADGKKDEPSPPASEGMLKLIRKKAEAVAIPEATIVAFHKIEKLEGINVELGNEILANLGKGTYAGPA